MPGKAPESGAIDFEKFWTWLSAHANCILRAGTPEVLLIDHDDFHWHMPSLDVKNIEGKAVGSIDLDDAVFAAEVHEHLLWETVKWQLAKRRQGTHSTKRRGEVRGTGKKPWKQKGTGRARQGSTQSPQWVGGGSVFGPKPRDYSYNMQLGFSHPIEFELPEGVSAKVAGTTITLSGIDKQLLGKTAAKVRSFRPPEPYKGKGVKYVEEHIQRKVGKAGAS